MNRGSYSRSSSAFENSNLMSHGGLSSSNTTIQVANSLPTFDLGFDKLQSRMDLFLKNFSQQISDGKASLMDERDSYAKTLVELTGKFLCD